MAVTATLSALALVIGPVPAMAGNIVTCPPTITEWRQLGFFRGVWSWEGYRYTLQQSTATFVVSDGRLLDNQYDQPATFSVTSQKTETIAVSQTVGIQATTTDKFLQVSVSSSIVHTHQTLTGITVTTTVPAHSTIIAEYGLETFDVYYYIEAWHSKTNNSSPPVAGASCEEWGNYPQHTMAPTAVEGWRLRNG